MSRFFRRRPRTPRLLPRISVLARLFWGLLLVVPPLVVLFQGGAAFLRLTDKTLAQAAPLVSAEASRQLRRPVSLGKLTPNLTLGTFWEALLHRQALGTLPVGIYDITLQNRPGLEAAQAGGRFLAHVESVTLFVSLPALLSGDTTGFVPRVIVSRPDLVLVRDAQNQFNITSIVPKNPNARPAPPFRTYVRIEGGSLRFRDYAALRPPSELPADNRFAFVNGFADLSGERSIRFQIKTGAAPQSATARRLGGVLSAGGELARGMPAIRPNAPAPESARFLVHLYVGDADVRYWVPYFVSTPGFRVTTGRADLNVALVAPRPPKPGQPIPGIGVTLGANIRHVGLSAPILPTSLDDATGTFTYNDGTLYFDAGARILGERVTTSGSMWNLTRPQKDAPPPKPQIAVFVNAPRIPVERAVGLLLPKGQSLPVGVHIGGIASLSGTLSGPIQNFVASAHVSGLAVRKEGLPPARNIAADLTYSGGLLGINNAQAQIEGGGQVRGRAGVRLAGLPVASRGNAVFAAQARDVNLQALEVIKPLAKAARNNKNLRFSGRGTVQVVGQRAGGVINAAANVSAQNLRVGRLAFPVARARVLVSGDSVVVPAARIESPAGIVSVSGNMGANNTLALRWAVASLDLAPLAQIAGAGELTGLLSTHGTVGGTLQNPRLLVSDLVALNLRFNQATDQPNQTRRFAADVVRAQNILVSKQSVTLSRPLVVRRFPASLTVGGRVSDFLPAGGKPFAPRLNLYARLQNLDFSEVQKQLAAADRANLRRAAQNLPRAIAPVGDAAAPFGGLVKTADLRILGTTTDPRVAGTILLDRLFVGKYPIDGGSVLFAYDKNRTHLQKAKVTASVGTITASGDVFASGKIVGTFSAPDLDLAKVAFLTGGASVSGKLGVRGTAGGTTQKPTLLVSVAPSDISVGGVALQGVSAQNVRYVSGAGGKPGRIDVPLLSFKEGGARASLTNASYNLQTGQVAAGLSVQTGDLDALVSALRQSGLSESEAGAGIVRALNRLPAPLGGQFTLNTRVGGTLADTPSGTKRFVGDTGTLRLTGTGVQVGAFKADTIIAALNLAGDVVSVQELLAQTPSATLRGSGTYNLATSEGKGSLETNEASLDLVRTFPGLETFPLYGTLSGATILVQSDRQNGLSVTASTEGKNLVYVPPAPSANGNQTAAEAAVAAVLNAPPPGSPQEKAPASAANASASGAAASAVATGAASSLPLRPGITVGSVRTTLRLTQDTSGKATVFVDDFLITRGAAEVRVEGSLPLALDAQDATVADRPIKLTATIPQFAVSNLLEDPLTNTKPAAAGTLTAAPKKRGNFLTGLLARKTNSATPDDKKPSLPQLGGTLDVTLSLAGTLRQPLLNGSLHLVNGQFRLPREPGKSRDALSPVTDLDADLVIDNSRITVQKLRAELGGTSGQKGSFGTVSVGGTLTLDDLANLQNLLRPTSAGNDAGAASANRPALTLGGFLDLKATFDSFRPEEENLLQLGEAASGRINGTILVRGPLRAPSVLAENNRPVRISDALLRFTSAAAQTTPSTAPKPVDPKFEIPIILDGNAVVTSPALFRFEAVGQANIAGSLSAPNVSAVITTQGGYFNLPTARFRVQKNGIVRLRYNLADGSVRAENVIAKARVYSSSASLASSAQGGSNTSGLPAVSSTPSVGNQSTGYTITATINGPLNLLEGTGGIKSTEQINLQFTSDPPLSATEIVALLGTQQQVDQARNGNVEGAFRGIAQQALLSSYVPQYLSPFTQGLQNSLGLADLTLDYNPNGSAGVYAAKSFSRFLLEYNQTLQTRSNASNTTQKQPYVFSLSYDLFRLRPTSLIQPRVQIGSSTNEQHIQTYFLRGKIIF